MTDKNMNDSLSSVATSLGEKSSQVNYSNSRKRLKDTELAKMYSNSWIVPRYLNKTAHDMLKVERKFINKIDDEIVKTIRFTEKTTGVDEALKKSIIWSKLYGDALIVAITNIHDNEYVNSLDVDSETIVKFLVFAKKEFTPDREVVSDITHSSFGQPVFYNINVGKGIKVHHSRCFRIKNGVTMMTDSDKYGISDIQPAYEAIKSFDMAMTCISDLLQDSNVDVIYIPDLLTKLATDKGSESITTYATIMKNIKSSSGMVLLDAGYDGKSTSYDQKQVSFGGLSDVISKLAIVVAGALNRPLKILFGESAKGFSNGEEDNTAYYETIHAEQEDILRPAYNFIDKFILNKQAGEFEYEFPSIDMPNRQAEAEAFNVYAVGMSNLVNAQVVTSKQALKELKNKGVVTTVTEQEIDDLIDSNLGLNNGDYQTT